MSIFARYPDTKLVYMVKAGSHAYGLNTPTSDLDLRGIAIPPKRFYFGLSNWEQDEAKDEDTDRVVFLFQKVVRLALACNPNIIEIFFAPEDCIVEGRQFAEDVRGIRHLFLSKRAHQTFGGYAYSQLQRLVVHTRTKHGTHAEIVEKHGYDTKNATHLIRLYRTGCELLETGEVNVRRADKEELLAIRNGAWPLERVLGEAERLRHRLDVVAAASPLPSKPDEKSVEDWVYRYTLDNAN